MQRITSSAPRPTYFLPAVAAAIASGFLLAACGGGGGGGDSGTPSTPVPSPPPPASAPSTASQADAEAATANGAGVAVASAGMVDIAYDTSLVLAGRVAAASPGAAARAQSAGRVQPQDGVVTTRDVALACPGGGTADITISGGTDAGEHNGVFDAGEGYAIVFTACAAATGQPTLDGTLQMTINSVTGGATAATLTATNLVLSGGKATLNGVAQVSRTSAANGAGTTETSAITSSNLTLATVLNGRNASFTVTSLSGTRTSAWDATSTFTGATWNGTSAMSGTANNRTTTSTTTVNSTLGYDANDTPQTGSWTVVRSDATFQASLSGGNVTLTEDIGSDGTIDGSWTDTVANLELAAG